jgi:acyl-CoA hydrolase
MKIKKVVDSKTIMTEMIMPNDTNPLGNLMGGNLMGWILPRLFVPANTAKHMW